MTFKMHLVLCRLHTGINVNVVVNGYMHGMSQRPITIQHANRQGTAIKFTVSGTKSVLLGALYPGIKAVQYRGP